MSPISAASRSSSRHAQRRPMPSMAIDLSVEPDAMPRIDWDQVAEDLVKAALVTVSLTISLYHHEALLGAMRAVWA